MPAARTKEGSWQRACYEFRFDLIGLGRQMCHVVARSAAEEAGSCEVETVNHASGSACAAAAAAYAISTVRCTKIRPPRGALHFCVETAPLTVWPAGTRTRWLTLQLNHAAEPAALGVLPIDTSACGCGVAQWALWHESAVSRQKNGDVPLYRLPQLP